MGRKHANVNYFFEYSPYLLFAYHPLIMEEMKNRGYNFSLEWLNKNYRGKSCEGYVNQIILAKGSNNNIASSMIGQEPLEEKLSGIDYNL